MYKELSARNNIELRVYRLLGVNQFRSLILSFEKIRHFKDKQSNENYHPSALDVLSLERYSGCLIYNAFLHGFSLLLTVLYAGVSTIVGFRNIVFDIGIVFLTLLNIYCIMLQRFNYLKLKEYLYRYEMRIRKHIHFFSNEKGKNMYALEPQKFRMDYALLSKMKKAFEGRGDCVLTLDDVESLQRICVCLEPKEREKARRNHYKFSSGGLLEQCSVAMRPYTALQMRAERLQRLFRVSGRKTLDCGAIITENAACEALYRALIPEDTAYNFFLICCLLYEAFTGMIDKVGTNEA